MSIGTFHSCVNAFLSCGAALALIASRWFSMLMLHFIERAGPSLSICTRLHLFSSSALVEGRLVRLQLRVLPSMLQVLGCVFNIPRGRRTIVFRS